jgi:hypothetical protein
MALSAGQQALVDVGAAFDAANAADVQLPALLHAATEMLKLYDLMFPTKGRVYDILKGDHVGHLKSLQRLADADRAAHPGAGDSVFPMLDREVAAKGLPPVRNDLCSGVCALLWFMRTVRFLGRFLDLLCDPANAKQDAFECARAAYKECLYPYHRMVVSMIVPLALGACRVACRACVRVCASVAGAGCARRRRAVARGCGGWRRGRAAAAALAPHCARHRRGTLSVQLPHAGVVGTRDNLRKNFGMPTLEMAYEYIGKCR